MLTWMVVSSQGWDGEVLERTFRVLRRALKHRNSGALCLRKVSYTICKVYKEAVSREEKGERKTNSYTSGNEGTQESGKARLYLNVNEIKTLTLKIM